MKSSSINHHSNSTNDDKTFRLLRLSNCWGGNGNHFQTCTHSSKSQFPHFQRDDLCLGWCNHFALIILGQGSGCCSSRRKSKSQCTCVCSEVIYLQFLSLLFGWRWCFMHVWCNLFVAIHFHFPLEMDRNPFGEHAFPFNSKLLMSHCEYRENKAFFLPQYMEIFIKCILTYICKKKKTLGF